MKGNSERLKAAWALPDVLALMNQSQQRFFPVKNVPKSEHEAMLFYDSRTETVIYRYVLSPFDLKTDKILK